MKKPRTTIMGVVAPAPHPEWRGFLKLALLLSGPVALILFGAELMLNYWGFLP